MKFSFVILTWNRKTFLEKCISGLLECVGAGNDFEVIVLDNGSDDGTRDLLKRYEDDPRFRLLRSNTNRGLNGYKRLLRKARGEYVVIVDDDVIRFPENIVSLFEEYFRAFPDFGILALDVVSNDFTNGAKPPAEAYVEVENGEKVVQYGPTGGWCMCFRRSDFKKIRFRFYLRQLNMKTSEDGNLVAMFAAKLGLKSGIIKGKHCLHASGPYFSKVFGYLDRDIEKYEKSGLHDLAALYRFFK